ncbi:MAG: hypothetical protein J6U40_11350 [Kiritimatiellae bacterium]|nr:hypothetical protein [Kiritimatiellia bacterium]
MASGMKRRFFHLVVLAGCIALFSGCGKKEREDAQTDNGTVTLPAFPGETPTLDWQAFLRVYGPAFDQAARQGDLPRLAKAWGEANRAADPRFLEIALARAERDWERSGREAEAYLQNRRDDLLATEVMERYAAEKRETDFSRLGHAYGKEHPEQLIAFSEIALHAGWPPMTRSFAAEALAASPTYAIGYRALQLLEACGERDAVIEALPLVEAKAEKRYQREDLALMTARLAIRRNPADPAARAQLKALAEHALMPDVRREAGRLRTVNDK